MIKEDSVLGVLMYLFHHHMTDRCFLNDSEDVILKKLRAVGFASPLINQAFDWLASLDELDDNVPESPGDASFRVFSEQENRVLNLELRGFLNYLEQCYILNQKTREIVIHQVLMLESEEIDLPLVKWVVLLVLFSQVEQKEALSAMELLVLDVPMGGMQ